MIAIASRSEGFRNVLILVSSLSFCYCAAELIIGWWIGSISVLMASVQFLQNGIIGLLAIAAINRPVHLSPATSALLAALIEAPALAALWLLYQKWNAPSVPDGVALTLTAVGALAINAFIAFVFARARGGIDAAALISARTGLLVAAVLLATGHLQ